MLQEDQEKKWTQKCCEELKSHREDIDIIKNEIYCQAHYLHNNNSFNSKERKQWLKK